MEMKKQKSKEKKQGKKQRVFFLVVDGMNDLPIKELKNKTPLEVAETKAMDFLASIGDYGMLKLFDFAPESDEAMMALLDLDPEKNYPGRGVLEAYGADLPLKYNIVYFRCNVAKVKGKKIIDFEADVEKKEEIEKMVNKIELGINFNFKFTKGHRAVLMFNGKLSDSVTNTNPAYVVYKNKLSKALPRPKTKNFFIKKSKPLDNTNEAKLTASKLNEFTEKSLKILKQYGLGILARGASKVGKWKDELKKFKQYKKWALISEMPVEIAIGKILGMKIFSYESDYDKLTNKILSLLKKYNVYIQIKGPDAFSHRGDYKGKIMAIERIDRNFILPLILKLKRKNIDTKIIITCDHVTSSKHLSHVKGNVTFLACDTNLFSLGDVLKIMKNKEKNKIKFCEKTCKKKKIINPNELFKL